MVEKFNKIQKETKIILVCVIALTLVSIGLSYSIFFTIKTNSNSQVITTGTLSVSYGTDTNTSVFQNLTPMTDKEGISQGNSSLIYLQNTGSLNSTFVITIGYDYNSFLSRTDYSKNDELVSLEDVRIALFEYNNENAKMNQIGSVLNVGDLPIYKQSENSFENKYVVYYDNVDGASSGNNAKTYAIKVWIAKNNQCVFNNYLYLDVNVKSDVTDSKLLYNLNGTVLNSDNEKISSGKISIQNDSYRSEIENGNFNLNNLREGIYLLSIENNKNSYNTVINIKEGTNTSIVRENISYVAKENDTIFNIANNTLSTIKQIKDNNTFITDASNRYNVNNGDVYTVNSGYTITLDRNTNVNDLLINLGTNNDIINISFNGENDE